MTAKTKISNLNKGVSLGFIDQQVLGLEIAVHATEFVHVGSALEKLIYHALDHHRVQRVCGTLSIAVHVLFKIGSEVFKDKVEARLAVLLQMLYTQQPAKIVENRWMSLAGHNTSTVTNEILNRSAKGTYLTIWLLSDSICKREISLRVVDGTPSSSICDKDMGKCTF